MSLEVTVKSGDLRDQLAIGSVIIVEHRTLNVRHWAIYIRLIEPKKSSAIKALGVKSYI